MIAFLRRWWTNKYKQPWTHKAFQEASIFELLVEYYEDVFEKDPQAMLEAGRGEDGEVVFEETGDPLIDKWEKELAMGITPDLTEGLPAHEIKRLNEEKKNIAIAKKQLGQITDLDERVAQAMNQDSMYKTKKVIRGSAEEARLLRRLPTIDDKDLLGSK